MRDISDKTLTRIKRFCSIYSFYVPLRMLESRQHSFLTDEFANAYNIHSSSLLERRKKKLFDPSHNPRRLIFVS